MTHYWKLYWLIVAATITNYLVMIAWSLPNISMSAGGLVPFDMRPSGYSFEEAVTFLSAISDSGREFYLNTQHLLDSSYPALLAITLSVGLIKLLPRYWGWCLAAIAILAGCFDYLENAVVAEMLSISLERLTPELVTSGSNWTVAKSISTSVASLVLLIFLVMRSVVWMKNRKSKANP